MSFTGRYTPPRPRAYDIYFERERDLKFLQECGVAPMGDISRVGGHASVRAMLDSDQRAVLSKHANLRPVPQTAGGW